MRISIISIIVLLSFSCFVFAADETENQVFELMPEHEDAIEQYIDSFTEKIDSPRSAAANEISTERISSGPNKIEGDKLESSRSCPICLGKIVNGNALSLTCEHEFHRSCIRRWRRNNPTCPLCRSSAQESLESHEEHKNSIARQFFRHFQLNQFGVEASNFWKLLRDFHTTIRRNDCNLTRLKDKYRDFVHLEPEFSNLLNVAETCRDNSFKLMNYINKGYEITTQMESAIDNRSKLMWLKIRFAYLWNKFTASSGQPLLGIYNNLEAAKLALEARIDAEDQLAV